jgi:TolB protein
VQAGPFTSGLSWSPDGRRIAFARRIRSGTSTQTDIYVADLRRGSLRRLTSSPADDDDPLWSPRGDWIAFTREREFRRGKARALYAISVRAGRSERLTREFFWLEGELVGFLEAAWSPDGRQLVLAAERATMPGLYVVGNGQVARLSRSPSDHDPEWSPDGRTIVFSGKHPSRPVGLHISLINPDGTGRRVISANPGSEPTWSPDGEEIAFTGFNGNGTVDIYVVRRNAADLRRVTRLGNVGFPSWQALPS